MILKPYSFVLDLKHFKVSKFFTPFKICFKIGLFALLLLLETNLFNITSLHSDKLPVDAIYILLGYIFNLTLLGAAAHFCFKFLQLRKKSGQKNQILNLNAKLSMIRMSLKAKIKTKSYRYRALFKTTVTSGDPVDIDLNDLINLNLDTGEDFQRYFDLSKRINSLLIAERASESPESKKENQKDDSHIGKEDFMGTDFKNEISILRHIKEMVEISSHLNKRIEAYNQANVKNPIPQVNILTFHSLIEVNRVFRNETDENSKLIHAA